MGRRAEVAARGFTLLELVVTLFVLALAVGLVAPAIGRSVDAVLARADVSGFAATLRHAREQAIATRQRYAVVVDPLERRVTVTAGDDDVRVRRSLSPRVAVEATPPSALTVRFEPQGSSSGGEFRLTSGAVAYRVTVDAATGRVRSHRE